ncbi:MAG TPA: aspartate kinase [Patescibacteria group bacterium]
MITVPEATKQIIERSRYLVEALSKDLINYSSLARYIKPELEKMLFKDVSEASIIMAIKRLSDEIKPKFAPLDIFVSTPEMIVRSNLVELTYTNSENLRNKYKLLSEVYSSESKYYFTLTEGVFETAIIVSKDLGEQVKNALSGEKVVSEMIDLSAITIKLPKGNVETPGVYYFFLKSLAWEGINIIEIVSTPNEVSIILEDENVNNAFGILKGLFPIKNLT